MADVTDSQTVLESGTGSVPLDHISPDPQAKTHAASRPDRWAEWQSAGLVLLVAFAMLTFFAGLQAGPAMGHHECINAQAARQTLQSGDWLIPHLNQVQRVRKTPLGIWTIAAVSKLLGPAQAGEPVSQYTARFGSALAGLGTVLTVFWLGSMVYGRRQGLVAGCIAAASAGMIVFARNAQVDMLLTFLTTLCFACFYRGALHRSPCKWCMLTFYVTFALAMMAKAPLPLATVGLALFVYWFFVQPLVDRGDDGGALSVPFRRLKRLWLLTGLAIFVVLAGAWPLYIWKHVPNVLELWNEEYLHRFSGQMTARTRPGWYYVPILFGVTVPYMLSLPEAVLAVALPAYRKHRKGLAYCLTWALVGTVFLSLSAFKRPHYVLSLLPAYCLLLAPVIDRLFFGGAFQPTGAVRAATTLISLVLIAAAVVGGVLLAQQAASLLNTYVIIAVITVALWVWACRSYAAGRRTLAFGQLNLGVGVMVLLAWPALGANYDVNKVPNTLADELERQGIGPDQNIFTVDDRPNLSMQFYRGYRIEPLIGPLEAVKLRKSRSDRPVELYQELSARIQSKLDQADPVYLIFSLKAYQRWRAQTDVPVREVFRLENLTDELEDAPVVVTQSWNEGGALPSANSS
ncbi:MAG: ArnT family glycosyltransferase [Phycisphaerae bacterium]